MKNQQKNHTNAKMMDVKRCLTTEVREADMKKCPHITECHEKQFEPVDGGGFNCNHCGKFIKHENNLSRHKSKCKSKKTVKEFKCPECPKSFAFQSKLNEHSRKQNHVSYNCDVCLRSFKRQDHFRKHKCHRPEADEEESTLKEAEGENDPITMVDVASCSNRNNIASCREETETQVCRFRPLNQNDGSINLESNEIEFDHHDASAMLPERSGSELIMNSTVLDNPEELLNQNDDSINLEIDMIEVSHHDASDMLGNGSELITNITVLEKPETPIRTRQYRSSKRKSRKLAGIFNSFDCTSSPLSVHERKEILSKKLQDQEADQTIEGKISDALLLYLKSLFTEKKFHEFYGLLQKIFPHYDEQISYHIANYLGVRPYRLSSKFCSNFQRKSYGGRPRRSLLHRQTMLNMFVNYSIFTVDRRNGRDRAKIREPAYIKFYDDLIIPEEIGTVERETNKRGTKLVTITKRVLIITLRSLQEKLQEQIGHISMGTVSHYKPFFMTFASEKEKVLCMCMLCLNIREKFDSLMMFFKTCDPSSALLVDNKLLHSRI